MSPDVQAAAERLVTSINAPPGVVGALAWADDDRPRIRIFVDPRFVYWISSVPTIFDGFPVEMNIRGEIIVF
jgi:hypothetical protein